MKYDATYQFGKSTVHVVSPGEITEEERERILNEFSASVWAIIRQGGDEDESCS